MDVLKNIQECCGCGACYNICPSSAISMVENAEGFLEPKLNNELCINCGRCKQVCPVLKPLKHNTPETVFAAWINDEKMRHTSSSGGVSAKLNQIFLQDGGCVCGAIMENFYVRHDVIENIQDLERMQGSKYVQSDMCGCYSSIRRFLEDGKKVIFSGTPCQVMAIRNFFAGHDENLLTVDVVCHGVPSPKVYREYLNTLKTQYPEAASVTFRDKIKGWKPAYDFALYANNGKLIYRETGNDSAYLKGFIRSFYNRGCCSSCIFAEPKRVGDITLGDFWGIGKYDASLSDGEGTSLIFCNTAKGRAAIDRLTSENSFAMLKELPCELAINGNGQLRKPSKASPYRDNFFKQFSTSKNPRNLIKNFLFPVGILNFHNANNIGAVLVPYAMQKVIMDLGYVPEIINYIPSWLHVNNRLENFRKKYLFCSKPLRSHDDLVRNASRYHTIVAGSDQIWKLRDTGIYMLNWAAGDVNLISYAASFGGEEYSGNIPESQAKQLLKRFDAISVREKSAVDICEKTFHVSAIQTLDPTLLLDSSFYESLISATETKEFSEPYLCGVLLNKKNALKFRDPRKFKDLREHFHFYEAVNDGESIRNVEDWIKCIRNADYVITDSFHGTCFSIIFKKNFISIVSDKYNGKARIPSLFDTLGIPFSRILSSLDDVRSSSFEEPIDWKLVEHNIASEKEISINFLKSTLAMPITHKNPAVEKAQNDLYVLQSCHSTRPVYDLTGNKLHFLPQPDHHNAAVLGMIEREQIAFRVDIDGQNHYLKITDGGETELYDKPTWYLTVINADKSLSVSIDGKYLSAKKNGFANLASENKSWEHFSLLQAECSVSDTAVSSSSNEGEQSTKRKADKEQGTKTLEDFITWGNETIRQKNWGEAVKCWALMRKKFPEHPRGYFSGAEALKENKKFEAADALVLEGLQKFPKEPELYRQYGAIATRWGKWPEAVKRWALMREKYPQKPHGYFGGARALKEQGFFEAADALALEGLQKFPKEPELYRQYGAIATCQENWPEAVKRWALMREKYPQKPHGYFEGARALKEQGFFETADALVLEGLQKFPKEPELYNQYGDIAVRLKNWEEAAKRWALMREKCPQKPHGYLGGTRALKEQGFFEAADSLILDGLEKFPGETDLYLEYLDVAYRQKNYTELARRYQLLVDAIKKLVKQLK